MNYLETIKNITKDKHKKTENMIFLIFLLIILLVSINYIFDGNKKNGNSTTTSSNIDKVETNENIKTSKDVFEEKLSEILSKIDGISEVSVLITYSKDSKQNIVYNVKEETEDGKIAKEKTVAYNEIEGEKKAIVESIEMPKIEGAMIVAKGADSVNMKSKIATTISGLTGIPAYKVQVFEKKEKE